MDKDGWAAVGGGVGDAVAVELLETASLAGGAVAFDTFTECFCHGVFLLAWGCHQWSD